MMFYPNKIKEAPDSNINEYQINAVELLPVDSIDNDYIIENTYIDNHYKNCNKVIRVNEIFDRYVKCIGINQITSENEFDFYEELDNVPLTKKYYYKLKSINSIDSSSNYYNVNIDIDVHNLIYNNYLKHNLYSNGYLTNDEYLNSLSFNSTINLNIIFDKDIFFNYTDCTNYVYSNDFEVNLLGHINCILFNDVIVENIINGSISLKIISDIYFENKFILNINDNDFYIEGDVESLLFKLTNNNSDSTINTMELNVSYIPFYKNIMFIKRYDIDNLSIIFDMVFLTNFIPTTIDDIEYNNLNLGNDYFLKSYKYQNSAKLSNKKDFLTAKKYTQELFNNIYQVETIENNNVGVVNVYSLVDNEPIIVQRYPFLSIEEKFKIATVLEHSSNIHNINEYIDNENIFINYDYTGGVNLDDVNIEDQQDYIDSDSLNLKIGNTTVLKNYQNNGNILHKEVIANDYEVFHGSDTITETYGSYEEGIKFVNSCTDSTGMDGDLLVCTSKGYTSAIDEEKNMDGNVPCMNNSNISQSVLTKLNNNSDEFTFVFLTNKYGFKNNYFKIGDFQKNVYGKIVIMEKETESINNMNYHVDVNDQDSTDSYDSILHIIKYNAGDLNYSAQNDSTLYAAMDLTSVDISNCNISSFNIYNHKKTINNTTYTDSSIINPTYEDIKYYCNTVNLGTPAQSIKYNIDINEYRKNLSVPAEYGVYSDFPTYKHSNQDHFPVMIFELTIPSDCSTCRITYDKFQESGIYFYEGSFPDNVDLTYNFNGFFGSEETFTSEEINDRQGETVTIIIKDKYYRELDIDSGFYLIVEYNNVTYGTNEATLPVPLGKARQIEDKGLNKHKSETNEFMAVGKYHIYNQSLPNQRIEKIKQCYLNNKINNTALFLD